MNIKAIFTDRPTREAFKDKVELVMATIVISGFVYKKIQEKRGQSTIEVQENS